MQPYTEALERALGGIVARATGELATIKAQAEAVVAAAGARVAEAAAKLAGLDARIADRLAAVKDGEPGRDGAVGERGERGDPGERGPAGDSVVGERGEPGPKGEDGAPGRDGADGAPGHNGMDGIDGAMGAPGRDGIHGRDGANGEKGEPGPRGDTGEAGNQGAPGRDGVDGKDGERGLDGAPGKLPIVRVWTDGVHYEGDVCVHDGATYQAQRDTGRAPGHDDWRCIAAAGADGGSLHIRGLWAATADYDALDVVALNGASFVALKHNPGACPGDGWQLLAQQGKAGKPGERGPVGHKGERGADGMPVVAATVDNEGMLTLTNGDGSTVNCDLYPLLTRIAASPR